MLIIHGDNQVESRQFLVSQIEQARAKGKEIVRLEGKDVDLERLRQALENKSLFGGEKLVVVENLLVNLPSKSISKYLSDRQPKNLIIWEGKEISQSKFKGLKFKEKFFKLPPIIFKFLDAVLPGNSRYSLKLLKQTVNQSSAENVFYMLSRQIRYLIIANQLGKKGLKGLHPFQQQKIALQAKKFNLSQLLTIHRKLLYIDWQQKTGQAPMDLAGQLDLLVASL
ncbi:hypothetical protein AMJ51_00355 [Microgenomates bacterium DG_75]|nr:MAG: hypothetical protein AMJ51_00355 [Microgenomates bacterium DG_75]